MVVVFGVVFDGGTSPQATNPSWPWWETNPTWPQIARRGGDGEQDGTMVRNGLINVDS